MATETAFYRLSEELLTMIVQQDPFWSFNTLKILRLTHPRFAYLDHVLDRMFSRIIVSASPDCLDRLGRTPFKDHVKEVEFASSIYEIDISRDQFFACAREQGQKISLPRAGKAIPDWRSGIPEREIEMAYEKYQQLHEHVVQSVESGQAVSMLATALRSFKNARSIHVGKMHSDYDPVRDGNTIEGTVLLIQFDNEIEFRAVLGDNLLRLTVQVLAESKIKPVDMSILCWTSRLDPCDRISGWSNLDLGETRQLILEPEVYGNFTADLDDGQESRRSVMKGCSALIRKGAQSIEELWLGTLGLGWGVGFADLVTPRLRILRLSWTSFEVKPFSLWLRRCHKLQELTMVYTRLKGPSREWRMMFEAVREMPNPIILTLDDMAMGRMSCDTSQRQEYNWKPSTGANSSRNGMDPDDAVLALSAFLSGGSDWAPGLSEALHMIEYT